jgi:hypothetical protein
MSAASIRAGGTSTSRVALSTTAARKVMSCTAPGERLIATGVTPWKRSTAMWISTGRGPSSPAAASRTPSATMAATCARRSPGGSPCQTMSAKGTRMLSSLTDRLS